MIRDLKLFSVLDDDQKDDLLVPAIHNEEGYRMVRETSRDNTISAIARPNIQIYSIDMRGDRAMTLRHTQQHDRKPLGESTGGSTQSTCTVCGASIFTWKPCRGIKS